jgi:ribosome-associated protein
LLERLLVLDTPVKQRRDSRPTRGSVRRRLEGKRRRSETKSGRRRQDDG